MLKGFKDFIFRGNVVDLAVGVVIGAAFGGVVDSLVKDILTPFIGAIAKVPDFRNLTFSLHGSLFRYGAFVNSLLSFVLVAAAIYFFVVLPLGKVLPKKDLKKTKDCQQCKSSIPLDATRCAFCGQVV